MENPKVRIVLFGNIPDLLANNPEFEARIPYAKIEREDCAHAVKENPPTFLVATDFTGLLSLVNDGTVLVLWVHDPLAQRELITSKVISVKVSSVPALINELL